MKKQVQQWETLYAEEILSCFSYVVWILLMRVDAVCVSGCAADEEGITSEAGE